MSSDNGRRLFESKGFNNNLEKTKVVVSGGITKEVLNKTKVYHCVICGLRVKANSVLCEQCGKLIHSKCAGVKRVTAKLSRNLACIKCKGNTGEAVEQKRSNEKWKQ